MKLRIKGNSVRLRLGKSEVLRLALVGMVDECTQFGPGANQRLEYSICTCSDEAEISADFDGRGLLVRIPWSIVQNWTTTEQVSILATQRVGDTDELKILVEKDFECIEPAAGESGADAFPNPQFAGGCDPAGTNRRSA